MNTRVNAWTIRLLLAWLVMLLAAGSAACFRTADSQLETNKDLVHRFVAVWALYEGTQEGQMGPSPPSGRRMELDFGGVFRIEDGMIAELWLTWDNLSVLTQLGHSPP